MTYNFIVTLSSKYKEVGDIFLTLLAKNFPCDNIHVFISLDQDIQLSNRVDYKYVNSTETLPTRILNIAKQNPNDYYICLLGDALICDPINKEQLDTIFEIIKEKHYDYCNLMPKNTFYDKKQTIRTIRSKERYGVSFIAFIASYDFLINEFEHCVTDYDFENKYLLKAITGNEKYLDGKGILRNNIFNIYHGIAGGKWVKKTYKKVKRNGITIKDNLPVQNIIDRFKSLLSNASSIILPIRFRYKVKRMLIKVGFRFKSEY